MVEWTSTWSRAWQSECPPPPAQVSGPRAGVLGPRLPKTHSCLQPEEGGRELSWGPSIIFGFCSLPSSTGTLRMWSYWQPLYRCSAASLSTSGSSGFWYVGYWAPKKGLRRLTFVFFHFLNLALSYLFPSYLYLLSPPGGCTVTLWGSQHPMSCLLFNSWEFYQTEVLAHSCSSQQRSTPKRSVLPSHLQEQPCTDAQEASGHHLVCFC